MTIPEPFATFVGIEIKRESAISLRPFTALCACACAHHDIADQVQIAAQQLLTCLNQVVHVPDGPKLR